LFEIIFRGQSRESYDIGAFLSQIKYVMGSIDESYLEEKTLFGSLFIKAKWSGKMKTMDGFGNKITRLHQLSVRHFRAFEIRYFIDYSEKGK